jgi:hypothetical protein
LREGHIADPFGIAPPRKAVQAFASFGINAQNQEAQRAQITQLAEEPHKKPKDGN